MMCVSKSVKEERRSADIKIDISPWVETGAQKSSRNENPSRRNTFILPELEPRSSADNRIHIIIQTYCWAREQDVFKLILWTPMYKLIWESPRRSERLRSVNPTEAPRAAAAPDTLNSAPQTPSTTHINIAELNSATQTPSTTHMNIAELNSTHTELNSTHQTPSATHMDVKGSSWNHRCE